uniref:Carboxypeptidase B n=2 Tax=Lygus hesperus TaxID=30085 RepID=A0A0A9XQJ7_LYGHE
MVPPGVSEYLREYLQDRDIEYTVLTNDLEADIKRQNPKPKSKYSEKLLKTDKGHPLTWTRFHRYKDILDYLEYLGSTIPDLVKIITIGKSSENRPLKVAHISSGKKKEAPAIWIDGGIHGREWVAPSTALFILKQLTENYNTNKAVVDGIDWFIMPVANPDGYEYSHSTDRFWRKNRSKNPAKRYDDYYDEARYARFFWGDDAETCQGVDLNRNWDFHWKEVGASSSPCKPTFAGDRPFSEPETRAMSDFIMDRSDQIKAYLSLHSYSQMLLLPWGYTKQSPKDYDDLMYVGRKAVEALQRLYGTPYKIGTSPSLLYPTSGSSDDWAKGKAGIKYSYTLELRDKGTHGFLLPASQIVPTGRETFAAVKTIAKHVINTSD